MRDKFIYIFKKIFKTFLGINIFYGHSFARFSGKNPVIVDLGANHGKFIEQILENNPDSECILIEADPFLIEELTQNLGSRLNVKIMHAAIGPRSSDNVRFYLAKDDTCNSLFNSFREVGGEREGISEILVPMITLGDLIQLFGLKEISLLKMDIEGSEWEVLENLSQEEYKRIHQISVEFHDFQNASLRERTESCIKNLLELGYDCICTGTEYMDGTPYNDCLFYDRKWLNWTAALKWFKLQPCGSIVNNFVKALI